eukprot:CAMPEP_0168423962 /NCGR_PEP_ID=MMETSP0228-20121227/34577_1 /TAXON_ID=133427 /ORGANISM="Protoceratium reticulatum, Strain CCCM 535 (=CCMP 1889)" /LENGTH=230 /DNA_ID=CAMNT_0008437937 /DNA_START=18 /DNA_END=710 /DNA_ORIENTATION=-
MHFDQHLIICNAYPSTSPVEVIRNTKEVLANASQALKFRECREMKVQVRPRDKLDLLLRDVELHGSFEVGALPASDAVLLLVVQKRGRSPLLAFQSFAFPSLAGKKDAQLAVIDAFSGSAAGGVAHLRMEDHMSGKEAQTVAKRVEKLGFSKVYAIEEGTYDASLADKSNATRMLKLAKAQNYVVIRTGEQEHFPESLVLFPEMQSGAHRAAALVSLALAAAGALLALTV